MLYHDEKWRKIRYKNICKDIYEISSYGRVRKISNKRILSSAMAPNGYLRINLIIDEFIENSNEHKRNAFSIHVLVFTHFCDKNDVETYLIGNLFERRYVVNHKDGNKTNNYYDNLELMTYSENNKHASKLGLMPKGENKPNSPSWVTNELVEKICKMLDKGEPNWRIIQTLELPNTKYTNTLISHIYSKQGWEFISEKYNFYNSNSKFKRSTTYSLEMITYICKLLEHGYSNRDIADIVCNKFEMGKDKIHAIRIIVSRIRNKQKYIDISKNYNF